MKINKRSSYMVAGACLVAAAFFETECYLTVAIIFAFLPDVIQNN